MTPRRCGRSLAAADGRRFEHWATSIETAYSPPEAERLWAIRHAASPILAGLPEDRRSLQVIEDACVPVETDGRVHREPFAGRRRSEDLPVVMFGHAGDGHIHVNLLPELARCRTGRRQSPACSRRSPPPSSDLGGTPSGEHGDGRLRAGTTRGYLWTRDHGPVPRGEAGVRPTRNIQSRDYPSVRRAADQTAEGRMPAPSDPGRHPASAS